MDYFKEKDYMDYGENNIFFFSQKMRPMIDNEGKILLHDFSEIWTEPEGNGQIFVEMYEKKII